MVFVFISKMKLSKSSCLGWILDYMGKYMKYIHVQDVLKCVLHNLPPPLPWPEYQLKEQLSENTLQCIHFISSTINFDQTKGDVKIYTQPGIFAQIQFTFNIKDALKFYNVQISKDFTLIFKVWEYQVSLQNTENFTFLNMVNYNN